MKKVEYVFCDTPNAPKAIVHRIRAWKIVDGVPVANCAMITIGMDGVE